MSFQAAWSRAARWFLFASLLAALTGCGSFYVDGNVKDVEPSRYRKVQPLHPTQLLFEFQTKGVPNARATDLLKARVFEQIRKSGLFTTASEEPIPGSSLLAITVNNVPTTDDAFSKGFVTGLTFGLAGTQVSDGYICSARYTPPGATSPVVIQGRHAIHTTIGNAGPPPNSVKTANIDEAVTVMLRQLIANVMLNLSNDPAFK